VHSTTGEIPYISFEEAKEVLIKYYNYSYIKDLLEQKYSQKVSLPTIIDRAKRNNFYILPLDSKKSMREVMAKKTIQAI